MNRPMRHLAVGVLAVASLTLIVSGTVYLLQIKRDSIESHSADDLASPTNQGVTTATTTAHEADTPLVPVPPNRQTFLDPKGRFQIDFPVAYFYFSAPWERLPFNDKGELCFDTSQLDSVGFASDRFRRTDGMEFGRHVRRTTNQDAPTGKGSLYPRDRWPRARRLLLAIGRSRFLSLLRVSRLEQHGSMDARHFPAIAILKIAGRDHEVNSW